MRTLKTTLKLCTQAFQTDWDVALQAAALAYRATPHAARAIYRCHVARGLMNVPHGGDKNP